MIFTVDENISNLEFEEKINVLPDFISSVWKLKNPKILISLVSCSKNFKNRKLQDQFKKGIIKVLLILKCCKI